MATQEKHTSWQLHKSSFFIFFFKAGIHPSWLELSHKLNLASRPHCARRSEWKHHVSDWMARTIPERMRSSSWGPASQTPSETEPILKAREGGERKNFCHTWCSLLFEKSYRRPSFEDGLHRERGKLVLVSDAGKIMSSLQKPNY